MHKTTLTCLSLLGLAVAIPAPAVELDRDGNRIDPTMYEEPRDPVEAPSVLGVTTYDNQADFLAAAGAVTTEDFESEPASGLCSGGIVALLVLSDFTATSSPDALRVNNVACFGNHNTTPGGANYLSVDTDIGFVSGDVLLSFAAPIDAFGLYLVDIEGSLEITIHGNVYPVPGTGDGGEAYFGIISAAPFTSIALSDPTTNDSHWSMDDLAYRASGPISVDPHSWATIKERFRDAR